MSGSLAIKLRCSSWAELDSLLERHIKRGRFFVRRETGAPTGTVVRIDLSLPDGQTVTLSGRVVEPQKPHNPPGMSLALDVAPDLVSSLEATLAAGLRKVDTIPPGEETLETDLRDLPRFAQAEADLADALAAELEALRLLSPSLVLGLENDAARADIDAAFTELTARYAPDNLGAPDNPRVGELAAEITTVLAAAHAALAPPRARPDGFGQDTTDPVMLESRLAGTPEPQPLPLPPPPVAPALPIAPLPPREPPPSLLPVVTFQTLPTANVKPAPRKLTADVLFGDLAEMHRGNQASKPIEGDVQQAMREAERLLQGGHHGQAQAAFEAILAKDPGQRAAGVGRSLARGLSLAAAGDRAGAAAYFEAVLQVDPRHERAARELASVRRAATENKRGLLAKLLGRD